MQTNPFLSLVKSRKFWLMILDVAVSLTTFFVTKYASPESLEVAKFVILTLQPVFVTVIGAIAYEDVSLNAANAAKYTADVEKATADAYNSSNAQG